MTWSIVLAVLGGLTFHAGLFLFLQYGFLQSTKRPKLVRVANSLGVIGCILSFASVIAVFLEIKP